MSNSGKQETGWASFKPSARPSIHAHRLCPFAFKEATMGRYGIDGNNKHELRAQSSKHNANLSSDHGTDEVDNVFSKPAHSISPPSCTQRIRMRRKSLDEAEHTETDSSDDSEVEMPARHNYQYSDTSYQSASLGTPQTNGTPVTNRRTPIINRSSSSSPRTQNVQQAKASQEASSKMLPLAVIVAIVVTVGSMFNTSNILTSKVIYDESRFYNDIDLLGMKYRINDNSVLKMQTGIATIFKRQDTGSFIFLYNDNVDNFNSMEFNAFVNDVSATAAKYLRNESTPVHYTLVEGSDLDMFGHSELIETFRGDLDKTGVMLVRHVEAIPSSLAMAFHYYCDEYNPLVKKSAIFFTLNLAKCPLVTDKKSTHAAIEKCLAQKWNGVPADSIGPLLTRVVSVVIDVTGAF